MSRKAKILFVYPNERQMSTIPPAIALLSQLLKQNGHTTDIFDTTFYRFEDDITLEDPDKGADFSLQHRPTTEQRNIFLNNVDDDDLHFKKNKEVLVYKNNDELVKKIFHIIENKKIANQLSMNSQMIIKKRYNRNKVLSKYTKII